ncbi:hypothetical protein ISS04_04625 [Candidatus Woesearchaeota archaeon]|nr:hypothetical protein [Candidatus Woesearchaeota archaeon]
MINGKKVTGPRVIVYTPNYKEYNRIRDTLREKGIRPRHAHILQSFEYALTTSEGYYSAFIIGIDVPDKSELESRVATEGRTLIDIHSLGIS